MVDAKFGDASCESGCRRIFKWRRIFLNGFVNGEIVIPLEIAQDHKRAYDGDKGPNTGGMGAYSPVPHIGQEVVDTAIETVLKPTAKAMMSEGTEF